LLEFLHVKPGKGSAFVRSKIKNLLNGTVQERTFRAGESVNAADVNKSEMQYTFTDGDNLCFMDMESFEEQRIPSDKIDNPLLMKAGLSCQVTIWNNQVIDVQLPQQVEYEVIECPPNFKGNSAQGTTKPATIEGGATVNVPMFIEQGQKIIVSTADCKYMGKSDSINRN
jgi:elongation factor P